MNNILRSFNLLCSRLLGLLSVCTKTNGDYMCVCVCMYVCVYVCVYIYSEKRAWSHLQTSMR